MTARRKEPPRDANEVTIQHDGQTIQAFEGEPLAAALMAAGVTVLSRSAKYHRPRGASCGNGDCTHCMVTIDGLPNRCACTTPCREGMVSRSQNVLGSAEHDLLGITDWMFPWGLDHHEMFTGVPLVQPVVQKFVRKLGGLGVIAEEPGKARASVPVAKGAAPPVEVDVLVAGAGPSGMAAALAAAKEGARVLLVEARDAPGGRLASGIHGAPVWGADLSIGLKEAGVELWHGSAVVQVDRNDGPLEVLVLREDHLAQVKPGSLVLSCGGYGATGIFENNDLPGVMAAEWAARLLSRWGILAGERPLICADEPAATTLQTLFETAGARPARVLPLSAAYAPVWPEPPAVRLVCAKGSRNVEKVVLETATGRETLACDLIVVATPPAPAFELALDAGAKVAYEPRSGGFSVVTDEEGRTAAEDVFACGTLTGPCSTEEAHRSGEKAGRSALLHARAGAGEASPPKENRHAS